MRIIWTISLLFSCAAFDQGLSLRAQNATALFPVCEKKEKCGYIDVSGKMIIAPKFTYAGDFSEGLAPVGFKSEGATKSGFIDTTGKVVFEHSFLYVFAYSDGLARFRPDESTYDQGFVDRTGKVVIEPSEITRSDFHEGLARISVEQIDDPNQTPEKKIYKRCFINKAGEIVIPCNFDDASDFSEGYAVAFVNKRAGFIDRQGKWLVGNVFIDAKPFSEGLAAVEGVDKNGKRGWGFINVNTDVVIGPRFSDVSSFSEGLAVAQVEQNGSYGYIDKKGNVIIPYQFSTGLKPADFSGGFAGVYIRGGEYDKEFAYIDRTGKRLNRKTYSWTDPFKNGLAKTQRSNYLKSLMLGVLFRIESLGSEFYINASGKTVWKGKPQF